MAATARLLSLCVALIAVASCGVDRSPSEMLGHTWLPGDDHHILPVMDTIYRVGRDDHAFGRVTSVGFDEAGRLYVFDDQSYELSSWDQEGRLVRTVGGSGDGPGEFRVPRSVFVFPNGTVGLVDIGHRAMVVYDSAGGHVGNLPLRSRPAPGSRAATQIGGQLVGPDEYWMMGERPRDEARIPIYIFSARGDSLAHDLLFHAWSTSGEQRELGFAPTLRLAGIPGGGVAVVDSVNYRIKLFSLTGSLYRVLERPLVPIPVTESAKEAERDRRARSVSPRGLIQGLEDLAATTGIRIREVDVPGVLEDFRASLEEMEFASEIPVVQRLMVDFDGRFWIERTDDIAGGDGPIDIVSPDGVYLGTWVRGDGQFLGLPKAFGPGGLMAYVVPDAMGVVTIVVVRVDLHASSSAGRP